MIDRLPSVRLPSRPAATRPRLARVIILLAAAALVACQADSDSLPRPDFFHGASETVRGASVMDVRNAVVDVMAEDGFRLASPFGNVMTFEKEGTRHDEIKYGSYGGEPLRQRVIISIEIGNDPESVRLLASGKLVRAYANMEGEETSRLLAAGRHRYSKNLQAIKQYLATNPAAAAADPPSDSP